MSDSYLNVAAYHFVGLDDLPRRRAELRDFCAQRELKGTILLAPEGINLFISGLRESVGELIDYLRKDPRLADLETKESLSREVAFNRMLVKIKKEIIAFGVDGIDPRDHTSPRLPAEELKAWLDEGRDVVLFDVRNDFECDLGTFAGAVTARVDHFRDFPDAVERLPAEWKQKPVVTFCTGGIRCEKAAPLLERAGFENVYQLDGGILKYFETCGGEHYDGECFVFDRRVSLDPKLQETDASLCFRCQHVLRAEDRASEKYEEDVSCPYCFDRDSDPNERMRRRRMKTIRRFQAALPGATPYENVRPLNMPGRVDGLSLIDAIKVMFPSDPIEEWMERINAGRIRLADRAMTADEIVAGGQSFIHVDPEIVEPEVSAEIDILDEDAAWIVVNKPAPLPVHPCGRFHRNTLTWMLSRVDQGCRLRPAHRLDANTTGLQIIGKDRKSTQFLHDQFAANDVAKEYLARVIGPVSESNWTCEAPISDAAGPTGRRVVDESGKDAITSFERLKTFADGTSLLLVKPVTGRTNQIRVHLWHQGIPVVGDPMYLPKRESNSVQVLSPSDPPLCLHAWRLRLRHPLSQELVQLETPRPAWAS